MILNFYKNTLFCISLGSIFRLIAMAGVVFVMGNQLATPVYAEYGINIYSAKDWSRLQPFLNVMKTARPWISQSEGKWDDQQALAFDENDYVKELKPGQWATTLMLTKVSDSFPGGEYIFLYEGEGEIEWSGNGRLVSSEPGRQVVQVTNNDKGFVQMTMKSVNPANYPKNMVFVQAKFEKNWQEQYFAPWLFELWGNAETFRYMDLLLANNSTIDTWESRPQLTHRSYWKHGIPFEEVVRLSNQAKRNAWVNIHHLATDDYIRKAATMFRDQLDPSLTVYYEFSNEMWNGMFKQARDANAKGKELGLDKEAWRAGLMYYAKENNRMFALLDEVYAGQPKHRYKKVIGVQAANLGAAKIAAESFDSYKNADCLAIGPYLTFNVPLKASPWNPDMPNADVVQDWSLDQLFQYLTDKALPQCTRWMEQQKQYADQLGLQLVAYEGGQHLTALGEANKNQKLVKLLADANRDPRMGEIYLKYFNSWTSIGGKLFCVFNDMQPYTEAGSWGLLEYVGQDPESSPKYRAIQEWAKSFAK